jgi:serine/threonine-protein kinase
VDPPALAAGTRVGEYEIVRELGRGGMGIVYLGEHPIIRKRVAIKVLVAAWSRDPEMEARFVQEARAANEIGHPNIVDVFAFGRLDDGALYLVMDHLEGESLEERLAREGRIPPAALPEIFDAVCDALAQAHARGIVHRDLKPDNLYLVHRPGGPAETRLLDFGIAKLLDPQSSLTQTTGGRVFGTPLYMAPEQAVGGEVDARVDVYALGVILFRALTGSLPFEGRTPLEVLRHQATRPAPRPSSLVSVPVPLDDLVARCLAKTPEERPPLDEIRAVLRLAASGQPRVRATRPALIYLSAALASGVLVLGAMATWHHRRGAGGRASDRPAESRPVLGQRAGEAVAAPPRPGPLLELPPPAPAELPQLGAGALPQPTPGVVARPSSAKQEGARPARGAVIDRSAARPATPQKITPPPNPPADDEDATIDWAPPQRTKTK